MDTRPNALSREEMKEIATIESIREMWGAEDVTQMQEILAETVYAVKFNFTSGGPGYFGDYFILAGDMLGEPVQLIRRDGKLVLL